MNRSRIIILSLVILSLILMASCKGSEKRKLPDKATTEAIVEYATLPSFKTLLPLIDENSTGSRLITTPMEATKNPVKSAFRTGVLTANMLIAEKRNDIATTKMSSTALVNSDSFVLGKEQKQKYLAQLSSYYQTNDWDKLGKSLDQLKKRIETDVWERQDFEMYTITILGGWIEATRQIYGLLSEKDSTQAVKITTENTWNMLRSNMELFKTRSLLDDPAIKETKARINQLAAIETAAKGNYSMDQINQALKLCESIKALF